MTIFSLYSIRYISIGIVLLNYDCLNISEIDKNDADAKYQDVNHSDVNHLPDNQTDVCEQLLNHKDNCKMSEASEHGGSSSSSVKSDADVPFLCNGDMLSDDSDDCVEVDVIRKMSRDHPESHDSSFSSNYCEEVHNIQEIVSDLRTTNDEEDDTVTSRMDLEKISSIKSRTSNKQANPRKESFEQRLRRTFTIKDAHTSEVTRRVVAIVIKYSLFIFNFVSWVRHFFPLMCMLTLTCCVIFITILVVRKFKFT